MLARNSRRRPAPQPQKFFSRPEVDPYALGLMTPEQDEELRELLCQTSVSWANPRQRVEDLDERGRYDLLEMLRWMNRARK